ncbi:hypothetical protein [Nocardia carnea]|uniref:hypothetical protein n=1 Tax=Nocardia carnea TaxID=37328 RepID=UPI002458C66E|nr:hypothetical protein [Nocardia carnea]
MAAAAPGLFLEPTDPAVPDPQPVNDTSSGSGFMHEPSGSGFSGPISSGSAEALDHMDQPRRHLLRRPLRPGLPTVVAPEKAAPTSKRSASSCCQRSI